MTVQYIATETTVIIKFNLYLIKILKSFINTAFMILERVSMANTQLLFDP